MQDIIPPRKSIRDVPLPEERQKNVEEIERKVKIYQVKGKPPSDEDEFEHYPSVKESNDKGPRKILWVIAAALVIGVVMSFFFIFSKATLTIVTKSQSISAAITATSTKDGKEGTIPYSIIVLNKDESTDLSGTVSTSTVQVQKKASGTITIYNNYSETSQALIATTRFQTKDGLVYRIDKAVTVPGQTTQSGQKVPGSVDAVVTADQAGPKYNIGKVDFTIPGFQGTAKSEGFYAKSKTDMTGGYVGNQSGVNNSDVKAKTDELQNAIKQELVEEIKKETPDTFIFFPTGLVLDFTTSVETKNGKSTLTGKGKALAVIFSKKVLTDQINLANGTNFTALDGWENLQAEISNTSGLAGGDFPPLTLSLQGNLGVGQEINIGELQRDIAGKPKSELSKVLANYPSVLTATAKITPFWKTNFPSDVKKINVTLTKQQ